MGAPVRSANPKWVLEGETTAAASKRGMSGMPISLCDVGVNSKGSLVSMSISVKLSGEECCMMVGQM